MAKTTSSKYKFRQARKDAKTATKGVFKGKKSSGRKAFKKDATTQFTKEDKEALKEIDASARRQRKGQKDFIIDDRGNKVYVQPEETPQERMARDRRAARAELERKWALEDKESRASKSEANMKASREAAVAKQKADKARNFGKPTPTLQQTPANEKPLSRPVKVKKTFGQINKEVAAKGLTDRQEAALQRRVKKTERKMQKLRAADPKKFDAREKIATDSKLTAQQKAERIQKIGKTVKPKPAEPAKPGKYLDMQKAKLTGMTRAERSAANKAAWAKMSKADRKNWKETRPGAAKAATPAAKPASKIPAGAKPVATATMKDGKLTFKLNETAPKRVTEADLKRNEAKGLAEAKKRVAAKNAALANSAKGKTQTPQAQAAKAQAKPEGKAAAAVKKAPKKFARTRGLVKGGVIGALAVEAGSIAKGSTEKDWREIQRLENKLAKLKGQAPKYKNMGSNKNPIAAMKADLGNLAANASMGIVGKTRRGRMDELNQLIAKQKEKNAKAAKTGSSQKDYSVSRKAVRPIVGTGGSTISTPSDKYVVKKGDTFSGIAKNAGVSLSQLRDLNPAIMKRKKYKQGNMIWAGTKVNLPKK